MPAPSYSNPEFDQFADDYDSALNQGLKLSGESKEFFARKRVEYLQSLLPSIPLQPHRILDFGCGTGTSSPLLLNLPNAQSLVGLEISPKSIQVAQKLHGHLPATFLTPNTYSPNASIDLAFANGVFHHIPPADRPGALDYISNSLRPGGVFALFENNPWNPGTRLVMSRIPFDRDAIPLSPSESKRILANAGFKILACRFLFFFPKFLRFLRPLESSLDQFPLGAQYLVLAQRP